MTVHLSSNLRYRILACRPTQSPGSSQHAARHKSITISRSTHPPVCSFYQQHPSNIVSKSNKPQVRVLIPVHVFFLHEHVREHEHVLKYEYCSATHISTSAWQHFREQGSSGLENFRQVQCYHIESIARMDMWPMFERGEFEFLLVTVVWDGIGVAGLLFLLWRIFMMMQFLVFHRVLVVVLLLRLCKYRHLFFCRLVIFLRWGRWIYDCQWSAPWL